MKILQALYAR